MVWKGYKTHLDVANGDNTRKRLADQRIVSHDFQVAIPLAQMSTERMTYLYELENSAYDAPQISGTICFKYV